MADLGTITAKLTADVGSFTSGLASANTSLEHFQNAAATATTGNRTFYEGLAEGGEYAVGSERGIRRIELALGGLTASTVGASHGVGQLAEGLLLFGGGSAVAITALAAIAVGYEALMHDINETAAAQKDLMKQLEGMGPHAKLVAEQLKLSGLQENLETWLSWSRKLGTEGIPVVGEAVAGHIIDLQTQITAQQNVINRAAAEYAETQKDASDRQQERLDHVLEEYAAWQRSEHTVLLMADGLKASDEMVRNINADLELLPSGETIEHLVHPFVEPKGEKLPVELFAAKFGLPDPEELRRQVEGVIAASKEELTKGEREAKALATRVGDEIVRGLVDGIASGTVKFGDILKNIVIAFIESKLKVPLFAALGIASPSEVGVYAGQMLQAGLAMGMSKSLGPLALNLSIDTGKLPPAMTPFDAARDANWQRLFRETSLVAGQQGFRP